MSVGFMGDKKGFMGIRRRLRDVAEDFGGSRDLRGVPGVFMGITWDFKEISSVLQGPSGSFCRISGYISGVPLVFQEAFGGFRGVLR